MTGFIATLRAQLLPIAGSLVAALAIALVVAWLRGNHYRDSRDEWRNVAGMEKQAVTAAEQAATAKAEAARIATENRYAELARKADREEPAPVADQRAAADRYADAHAGVRAPVHCGPSGGPTTAATNGTALDRDGPGTDALAGYVTIPREKYDQFRDNTLRLDRVRIWGESLIADGLAIRAGDERGK